MKWCLADAFALALDEKEEHPELDFPALVNQIWSEMEKENGDCENGGVNDDGL